jgi:hypothetical protein
MSTYNPLKNKTEQITPPGSFLNAPLSPPLTEETKPFTQVRRVLDLFRNIKAGRSDTRIPWRTYQLGAHEELEALERDLKKDSSLEAFVKNKIRCAIC